MHRSKPRVLMRMLTVATLLRVVAQAAAGQCQVAKLTPDDGAAGDKFGCSVAISSQWLIAGARGDDDHGSASGAAYLFQRCVNTWWLVAKLTAEDASAEDLFGWSVGLGGEVALVGAPYDDDSGSVSGSAYVFERRGDANWFQVAKLTAGDAESGDFFGRAVAVSADVAVVGSPQDNDLGTDSGSVYVFERGPGCTWSQTAKLLPDDGDYGDQFGTSVAIDGDVIVIGTPDDEDQGNWSGSAYVFEASHDGTWSQAAKLLAADGGPFHSFGEAVAVSGSIALVGAFDANGLDLDTGAAYVFQRDARGAWPEVAKLMADDGESGDRFGRAVAIDGTVAVVGAWADEDLGPRAGSAYVFVQQQDRTWLQVSKLVAEDGASDDWFGRALGVSGSMAVIGAQHDDDQGEDSGSAYVFAVGPDQDGDGVMDACECPGDLNHDWIVDYYDLAVLLADWGCDDPHNGCPGDADRDGDTDHADLGLLLANWGQICP